MKVVIVNDTDGPHFGCQLVMQSFREQLDRVGIELLGTVPKRVKSLDAYPDFVARADLVIVNGEGSIHHGKRGELIELATRYPAVLVNCVYQDNPARDALTEFRLVTARESRSAAALADHGVRARVIPDVILSSRRLREANRAADPEGLGITDNVVDEGTDPGEDSVLLAKVGAGEAGRYLEGLGRYRGLAVGRFHTMLAAASMGIPFAAWPSNTHKIEGALEDMGVPELLAPNREEAARRVPAEFDERIAAYVEDGRRKIDALFEELHELA